MYIRIRKIWVGLLPATCIAVSALLISGCGKDKTLDQFHDQEVNEELSKLQAISGQYRGTITDERTNSAMGLFEIDLNASLQPTNSSDNSKVANQAVLKGGMTLINATQSSAALQTAQYYSDDNSDHGSFSGTLSLVSRSGTVLMAVTGTINGNSFTGVITPSDHPGSSGRFTLTKGAPLPHDGQHSTNPGFPDSTLVYKGSYIDSTLEKVCRGPHPNPHLCNGHRGPVALTMTVNKAAASISEAFLNNFLDQKLVEVQIAFGDDHTVALTASELDEKAGTLRFQGVVHGPIDSQTTLICKANNNAGYHCNYYNGGGAGTTIPFDAVLARRMNLTR